MKRAIIFILLASFMLSGCANLGGLVSLAAAGYGIYRAVKK